MRHQKPPTVAERVVKRAGRGPNTEGRMAAARDQRARLDAQRGQRRVSVTSTSVVCDAWSVGRKVMGGRDGA